MVNTWRNRLKAKSILITSITFSGETMPEVLKAESTVSIRQKDAGIEMLKFIAAIIIVNSHMGDLYVCLPQLATGGALGDALFFFCSGFGLALSKKRSFWNYYKRRVGRIYPAVFAWAIILSFLFHRSSDMKSIVLYGGGWFVTCIMVYYAIFWFIHRYLITYLKAIIAIVLGISVLWFFIFDSNDFVVIYGKSSAKYIFFFGFMLLGSLMGLNKQHGFKFNKELCLFVFSILCFYGILVLSERMRTIWQVQIASLIPLLGGVIFLFRACSTDIIKSLFNKYRIFGFIGSLCLEMYIVQSALFTTAMNDLFPLNLLIMLLIVVVAAFFLRCSARIFEQLFRKEDFDLKNIVSLS